MATQPSSKGILSREQANKRLSDMTAQSERDAEEVSRQMKSIERSAIQARAVQRMFDDHFPIGSPAIEELRRDAERVCAALDAMIQGPEFKGLVQLLRFLKEAQSDGLVAGSKAASGLSAIMVELIEISIPGTKSPEQVLEPLKRVFVADGVKQLFSDRAAKKHQNNRKASARIPEPWTACKSEGKTKQIAATEIAAEINLSVATVRKKLQGL